ncbi:MAG: hypothetical protein NTW87_26810, partial [Planctomycetota bacterium]|nr:hypothetical protein [Planctomycetota bacterium]
MRQGRLAFLAALFLAAGFRVPDALRAADEGGAPAPPPPKQAVEPPAIARAAKPFKVPAGDAQKGWDAFLKNDCAGAETAFREALKNNPKDLILLEGLRAAVVARGDYKEAQKINLQMVDCAADTPLANVFAGRAVDALPFVESRAAVLETFSRVAASACPAVAANLKDHIATLYYQTNRPEEARKILEDLGYVDKWLFVAGPFGSKDRNNTIEKRFAPERALKSLEFTDPGGEKIEVHKDAKVSNRDLNLDTLYPGAKGVFYAFTNLQSDGDQDVMLGVSS